MEKRRPTYDLDAFKAAMSTPGRLAITKAATQTAFSLGFTARGIVDVVQTMRPKHFYKSMTSVDNRAEWQDVYHVPKQGLVLYVKFRADVLTDFRILSFKEK